MYHYSFVIRPDGTGAYFDYSSTDSDRATAEFIVYCKKITNDLPRE